MAQMGLAAAGSSTRCARTWDAVDVRYRHSARQVFVLLVVVTVGLVGMPELQALPWAQSLSQVRWPWVVVAGALSALSFVGAAWNLIGFSPAPVSLARAVAAQGAATAAKVVTPAGVGALAVNTRLLQRAGATTSASVAATAGSQAAQFLVTVVALAAIALLPGYEPELPELASTPALWAVVVLGAVALAGAAALLGHRRDRACRNVTEALAATRDVLSSPRRCTEAFGGSLLLTAALIGALWASVSGFGTGINVLDAAVVLVIGTSVGSAVPTPGGAGGVEVALTAGLTAVGVPATTALPAVLVYRLVTFWLPLPLGLLAAGRLRAVGAL